MRNILFLGAYPVGLEVMACASVKHFIDKFIRHKSIYG
jgi:hypothetical protein